MSNSGIGEKIVAQCVDWKAPELAKGEREICELLFFACPLYLIIAI